MDWKAFLAQQYDDEETRLRFLDPIAEDRLTEIEPVTGPVAPSLRELLLQTNGVLMQWVPPTRRTADGWEDSEWLLWNWDRIKTETMFNRELITEDPYDRFDPGTLVFFTNAGLSSVAYGCNREGEVWIWGPISGEFERRFADLATFFETAARGKLYG